MTVIVAARLKKGGIGLAADSLTTAGWEKEYADRTKLWSATPYALGAAGAEWCEANPLPGREEVERT